MTDLTARRFHMSHCDIGDYEDSCKYGEHDTCPALSLRQAPTPSTVNQGEAEILREAGHEQFEAIGGGAERAQILAWLRGQAEAGDKALLNALEGSQLRRDLAAGVVAINRAADAIERGDHLTAQGGEG